MFKIQSIGFKLFLALTLTALCAVLALAVLFWWSLGSGFNQYVARLELTRLDSVENALITRYQTHQNWSFVRGLQDLVPPPHIMEQGLRGRGASPAEPPPPPKGRPGMSQQASGAMALRPRLALLDAKGELVMGRPEALNQPRRALLDSKGVTVGYLALAPETLASNGIEYEFMRDQAHFMALSCLLAVLLSALAALLLSRYFRQPIAALAGAAGQLAAGNLHTRVQLNRRDELGALADDFNRMAQKLEHFEQARRQWVADTSHELRTPLTIMRAHTEAMRDGVMPLDQRGLARIESGVDDLENLVNDLYQLARLDIGVHDYLFSQIAVSELFDELEEKFHSAMQQANLSLSVSCTPNLWVRGDYSRLIQLLNNLLNNSLGHTTSGGQVQVTATTLAPDINIGTSSSVTKTGSSWVRITIEDSAPGVPEASLAHLFERFYRVDASHNRRSGGSGLGLAICAAIVNGHGGAVNAQLSSLGGLRIVLDLPGTGASE